MRRAPTRRYFLRNSVLSAAAVSLAPGILRAQNVGSKLNIACIGVGGRGGAHLGSAAGENLAAICDVDANTLAKVGGKYPDARQFQDYRELFDTMANQIDAVIVATPDHHHFPASMLAIRNGKHVYCEKPLTHTMAEARMLTEVARKARVMTQMGNQGHSGEGYRLLCEYIWSGAIGDVSEVHCWTNRPIWPQGLDRPAGQDTVPAQLNWDVWIGPAPMRPYKEKWGEERLDRRGGVYHPFNWRGWWDFGTGALGDMGCHIMDGACWSLFLTNPTKIELVESSELKREMAPRFAVLRYHFPQRTGTLPNGQQRTFPACTLTWYDGGKQPERPADLEPGRKLAEGDNGSLFIGSRGKMMSGTYGGGTRIFPEKQMQETKKPEPMIDRVPGPQADWIRACKTGKPSSANFEYAGPFTELVLLGNLALRVGQTIEWDARGLKVINAPEANAFIRKDYRAGWDFTV